MKKIAILALLYFLYPLPTHAQYADAYEGGMKITWDAHSEKYVRLITWGHAWYQEHEGDNPADGFSIKRARFIAYSQVNSDFMILIHMGLNNVRPSNAHPAGLTDASQMYLLEMALNYKINKNIDVGAGLHFWGGLSRLNGTGTINMLTLDYPRSKIPTVGLSDQGANHFGVFSKGNFGKINYRVAISEAIARTADGMSTTVLEPDQIKYLGRALTKKGRQTYAGYFDYNFLDQESQLLPYKVGTYLGGASVFNIGAGFFGHPNALVANTDGILQNKDVWHWSVDAFYDAPTANLGAWTAYLSYTKSLMGNTYLLGDVVGNGNQVYGHLGFLIPRKNSPLPPMKKRWQPYVGYSQRHFTALPNTARDLKLGVNFLRDGHNAKLTMEYQRSFHIQTQQAHVLTLQAMILL